MRICGAITDYIENRWTIDESAVVVIESGMLKGPSFQWQDLQARHAGSLPVASNLDGFHCYDPTNQALQLHRLSRNFTGYLSLLSLQQVATFRV